MLALLAAFSLFPTGQSYPLESGYQISARVVRVHDGDTVSVIASGRRQKVRLIGIDAPELGQEPWGIRAKMHLEELLRRSGWMVTLEFDIDRRDKYGRLLAYLRSRDGTFINLRMLKDGYAVLFTFPPNVTYANDFTEGQRYARTKGLGIWGRNGLREPPQSYKRKHPRL